MRLKILMLLFLSSVSSTLLANPTLVVLVDVNCPFCRELHKMDSGLRLAAQKAGVDFMYAPIPNDGDMENAWSERAYYACAKSKDCDDDKLLTALYDAQDAERLVALSDVMVWLETVLPDRSILGVVESNSDSTISRLSLMRSVRLAGAVKIKQFPTFAVVGDEDLPPYQIATQKDAPLTQRVGEVMMWLKTQQEKNQL